MRLFELSKAWPKEERYALTDQIRRSSRSVCANIAEAWRKRRYPKHFASKLSDADAEIAETRVWLRFASHCGYLTQSDFTELDKVYNTASGGLASMINTPGKWCGPARLVQEDEVRYEVAPDPPFPPLSLSPSPSSTSLKPRS